MTSFTEKLSRLYPKSLISEFCHVFGPEDTERLLSVFGGMKLKVPSHEDISKMKRNLEIYEAMVQAKAQSPKRSAFRLNRRILQARYGMKKKKMMAIYKQMDRLMRQSKEVKAADVAVTAHKKPARKKRRRR